MKASGLLLEHEGGYFRAQCVGPPFKVEFLPETVLVGDRTSFHVTLFNLRPPAPGTEDIFSPSIFKLLIKNEINLL